MLKKILSLIAFSCITIYAQAQIAYFTPAGAGLMNGTSWTNAYPANLLSMIVQQPYAEIWVAAGTYKPALTDRDSSFSIHNGLKVYGGFTGNETNLSQRDPVANVTILSGDIGTAGDPADNSHHVVFFDNTDSTTLLDGFTITGGAADGTGAWQDVGGGILNWAQSQFVNISNPVIRNCIIKENFGLRGGGVAEIAFSGKVGGRYVNCLIEHNTGRGGGFYFQTYGDFLTSSYGTLAPYIDSCTIRENYAIMGVNGSGGIYVWNWGGIFAPTINHTLLEKNKGGCMFVHGSNGQSDAGQKYDIKLLNSRLTQHGIGENSGLGTNPTYVLTFLGGNMLQGDVLIENTTMDSNYAGGIFCSNNMDTANITIKNSQFIDMSTTDIIGQTMGNSINTNNVVLNVSNSLFYNGHPIIYNTCEQMMTLRRSNVTFKSSTLYGKRFPVFPFGTNMNLIAFDSTCTFAADNSIFWFSGGVENYCDNIFSGNPMTQLQINNCVLKKKRYRKGLCEDTLTITGISILTDYPKFADTANGNLRLSCGSVAIDAGSNAAAAGMVTDLDGTIRIQNGQIDMGAYETGTLPIPQAFASIVVNGNNIAATASSNVGIDSLEWTFGDGDTDNQVNTSHTYATTGTYNVCLTVYTSCGQDDTCINVNITGVSVNQVFADNKIAVYPNPASEQFTIQIPEGYTSEAFVTDMAGRTILHSTIENGPTLIDTREWSEGIYLLHVTDGTYRKTFKDLCGKRIKRRVSQRAAF